MSRLGILARLARCNCPRTSRRQHVAHGSCGARRSLRFSARQSGTRCSLRCARTRCCSCRLAHPLGLSARTLALALERKCSPRCPTWAHRVFWRSKRRRPKYTWWLAPLLRLSASSCIPRRLRSRRMRRPSSCSRARSCGLSGFSRPLSTRATLTSWCAHSSHRTVCSLSL